MTNIGPIFTQLIKECQAIWVDTKIPLEQAEQKVCEKVNNRLQFWNDATTILQDSPWLLDMESSEYHEGNIISHLMNVVNGIVWHEIYESRLGVDERRPGNRVP